MKVTISIPGLLLVLLSAPVSESRSWRRPTAVLSAKRTTLIAQQQHPMAVLRGGHDDDTNDYPYVPIVPESTNSLCSTSVHARGGSTTTKQLPSSTSPISILSVSPTTNSIHTKGGDTATGRATTASAATANVPSTSAIKSTTTTTSKIWQKSTALSRKDKVSTDGQGDPEHKPHKKIAKKLRNRNARNLRRKVMHASFGFFFAALNHFIPKAKFVPGMTILTSVTLLMELLRYRKGFHWMNDILHLVLGKSLRKNEMDGKFTGSFYYFLGVTVTAALYPTSCATLGICQLAIADPTASFFGRATRHVYWSRIENGLGGIGRNKGLLGFIGGALACVPMNYRLLSKAQFATPVLPSALWTASLLLGLAGAFADLAVPTPTLTLPKKVLGIRVPPFHVDDNFVVPLFSGMACQYVFQFVGFEPNLALAKFLVV